MGKVLIKDTTLTDIANAIRTKDGSGGIVKDNRYVAQLYKNGVAINGATAIWGVDGDKRAAYIGNISCSKGDRIEIYFSSYDRDSLSVTELIAEEI